MHREPSVRRRHRECRAIERGLKGVHMKKFVALLVLATALMPAARPGSSPVVDVPVEASPVLEDRYPQPSVAFGADVVSLPDLVYSMPPGFRPLRLDLYRPRNAH